MTKKQFLQVWIGALALIVGLGMATVINNWIDEAEQEEAYNNGVCKQCDTEWHFKDAGNDKYIYECENGHIIELDELPEE